VAEPLLLIRDLCVDYITDEGPVRALDSSVTFSVSQTIEFRPDGTAYRDPGGGAAFELIPTTGINIRVARSGVTRTITVNGLGKVQLQ